MPEFHTTDTIPGLFEAQVYRSPDAIAIEGTSGTISYAALNRKANLLARAIRSQSVLPDKPVAFLLEDGSEQIVAVLALFKAGRIAVPMDPGYPPSLLQAMLADSGCELVIESQATAPQRATLAPDCAALDIDTLGAIDDTDPEWQIDSAAWANIYYTSGTTGEPKGVIQTQQNILRFVQEMARDWKVTPDDRFMQLISCSFSAVLLPILVPLLHGATVVPFDLRSEGTGRLGQALVRQDISVLFCVPSVFRAIPPQAQQVTRAHPLRLCVFTGEPLHWSDVARLRELIGPACGAINLFGGSEMHHVASLWLDAEADLDAGVVPAGRAAPGKELLLLDEAGKQVPDGEVGELLVRGHYLSPCYWRRPDLTLEAFVEAQVKSGMRGYRSHDLGRFNADGLLELRGRSDSRVKLRGQMVETAAVEAAIAACPGVTEAAVCLLTVDGSPDRLVAFVATEQFEATTWAALNERLRATIPAFMVPSSFVHLPALPRGPGGKTDRVALAGHHAARCSATEEYTPPRNTLERQIAAAVEYVLEQFPISVKDDLFDLGLDSLRYADLHVLLEQELGRRLPDEVFIHARTVEQLAAVGSSKTDIPVVPGGGQDYGKPWPQLDREMRTRYHSARLLGLLPFRWGFAGLSWLSKRSSFWRAWSVREHVKLAQAFAETIESGATMSALNRDEAVSRSLRCNYVQPWLLRSLARAATRRFERQCTVDGLEHFERARQSNRGVILAVSHFGIPHADLLVLDRSAGKGIVTFGSFEYELKLMGLEHTPHVQLVVEPVENFVFRANFLRHARSVLESGGIVRIAADGLHGTSGRAWPFHGRNRHFRPGVGELAVATGAPVVPVFGVLSDDGRMEVQFLPELDRPATGLPRQEAVDSYVSQYVRLLEQRWALDPGSVLWEIAQSHLGSSRANQ